jgi:hypothetical protein
MLSVQRYEVTFFCDAASLLYDSKKLIQIIFDNAYKTGNISNIPITKEPIINPVELLGYNTLTATKILTIKATPSA